MFRILFMLFLFTAHSIIAQDESKSRNVNVERGLALQGYDPVAYFRDSKPVKGKASLSVEINGIVYWFATTHHKELFKAKPSLYEPQYGGWCAYAMGDSGEKVEVDPETFKIIEGKLYLFYNAYFNNTLKKWNADEKRLKAQADANWKSIK